MSLIIAAMLSFNRGTPDPRQLHALPSPTAVSAALRAWPNWLYARDEKTLGVLLKELLSVCSTPPSVVEKGEKLYLRSQSDPMGEYTLILLHRLYFDVPKAGVNTTTEERYIHYWSNVTSWLSSLMGQVRRSRLQPVSPGALAYILPRGNSKDLRSIFIRDISDKKAKVKGTNL